LKPQKAQNIQNQKKTMTTAIEAFQLSLQQKRLWLLQQRNSQPFCAWCAVLIDGDVESATLRDSLHAIVARHEIFRTTLQSAPEIEFPVQVIANGCPLILDEVSLCDLTSREQEIQIEKLFDDDAVFDLQYGPLLKATLIKLSSHKHVLLLALPTLCADARTVRNLVEELAGVVRGEEFPSKPIQYADFGAWQNALLDQNEREISRTFWQRHSVLSSACVKLPSQLVQHDLRAFTPHTFTFHVGPAWLNRIDALAEEHSVSTDVFLLAVWQILLWRLTGESAIAVGNVFDGRNYEDLYDAMGLFAKTLPIVSQFEANSRFGDILKQTHEAKQYTSAQQEYLFLEGREPAIEFCPIAFEFQDRIPTLDAAGATFSIYKQSCELDRFHLKLSCARVSDLLNLDLVYDRNSFQRADIRSIAGQFITLLRNLINDSHARLADHELLNESDRHRIAIEWNDTEIEYPVVGFIKDFIESQVEQAPAATAVVFEDQHITYAELNRRANQLARHLHRLGIGPESVVGLCFERSVELIVGLLALLKAGAAYLPLDPLYPSQRVELMIEESGAPVVLTQSRWLDQLSAQPAQHICLDRDWESIAGESDENVDATLSAEQAAYVIYTSGSTGRPKGAVNTQGGLRNRLLWMQDAFGLSAADRVLQKTPFTFDVSVWEFFWPLMTGACLVVAQPEGHKDPDYLVRTIQQEQISTLHFVPSMLQVFLGASEVEQCRSLRQVFSSGEALSQSLAQRFFERVSAELHNLYGPTEAAIDVTRWSCRRESEWSTVPIGRPIANTDIYLLDAAGHQVPVGVSGELHIGGAGLSRGYLNRADLTAEKFVPHGHSQRAGARLYKTGDLARYLGDGEIEYQGRMDQQVKLRGFRIELGEIESVLREHPGVEEAVVLMKEYSPDDIRLVAYVVSDSANAPVVNRLVRFEKERRFSARSKYELPNGMIIVHKNKNETDFMFKEIFEEETYLKHGIVIRAGDCIFDVGANIGLFSLSAGLKHKDVRIYAFEPMPPIFEALRINTALYDLNVKLFDCGLSNESKSDTFTYYPFASLLSGRFADAEAERESIKAFLQHQTSEEENDEAALDALLTNRLASERFTCRMKTLSEVIREHRIQQIDLLKIDVEKGELDVLAGINESDWARIRQIVIEVHDIDDRLKKIAALLEGHGYNVAIEQDAMLEGSGLYNVYASSKSQEFSNTRHETDVETASASNNPDLLLNDVRRLLKDKLPSYMVPSAFVLLDTLPLTANGKLDRRALPSPNAEIARGNNFVAPATEIEQTVAAIWQKVLQVEKVGIEDNFFDLGGHSFLLIKVYHELKNVFERQFEITELLKYPTISSLTKYLAGDGNGQASWQGDDRTDTWNAGQSRLKQRLIQRQQPTTTGVNAGY
jgi:amino acid adenylation domain-containing protein/FkbM family methyltransferase